MLLSQKESEKESVLPDSLRDNPGQLPGEIFHKTRQNGGLKMTCMLQLIACFSLCGELSL